MTKLRICLMLCGSLLLGVLFLPVGYGCGFTPEYFEGYLTFIESDLAHDPFFVKYYYDRVNQRSAYQIDEAIGRSRTAANLREWQKYFGAGMAEEAIAELVYQRPRADLEKLWRQAVPGRKTPPSGNQALDALARPENRAALEYLIYAKQCEPYAIITSPWDLEEELKARRKPAEMQRLIEAGLLKHQAAKAAFFKVRYGYQIVRLASYAGKPRDCLKYYQQLVAPWDVSSVIAAWAARQRNGALRKVGRQAEALVLTSLLFDQNAALMDEAYTDFRIPPETVWADCLRRAGHPHRQATLWMLRGLREERIMLLPLQKMYELEPGSPRVEVMLLRHLNRMERQHFGSALFFKTGDETLSAKKEIALKYLLELDEFIKGVDRRKVRQPALWDAVAAYLSMTQGRYDQARMQLAAAEQWQTRNQDLARQIEFLQCLNGIVASPRMTEALENSSCNSIQWLNGAKDAKSNLESIRQSFYILMARKYLRAGDLNRGYLCLAMADTGVEDLLHQFSAADYDRLIAFFGKPGKTPFERLLTEHSKYTVDDLSSFKGTLLLRQGNYREALAVFAKINTFHWEKVRSAWSKGEDGAWPAESGYGELRTSFVKSCYNAKTGLYRYPAQGFPHFTKLEFTRKVVELLETARRHPEKADRCYYQIANGFFHTPFWARDENEQWSRYWEEADYGRSGDLFGLQTPPSALSAPAEAAGGPRRVVALSYYLKALQATEDPELAAECLFLAQACKTEFSFYKQFEEQGKSPDSYFALLHQKYSHTAYYQNVLRECATLKDYVAKAERAGF